MNLLAGPFVGELGWELFCWQGRLRWLASRYESVHVMCRPGHEFLYADFAGFSLPTGEAQGYLMHGLKVIPSCHRLVDYDARWTDDQVARSEFSNQRFASPPRRLPIKWDVVIHARARKHRSVDNWQQKQWDEVAGRFDGLRVAWVGTGDAALCGPGADLRGRTLHGTADVMRAARIVLGTSSGPMHLASLLGVPHVVLTGDENRARYERHWNPFRTPVSIVHGGWHPSVDAVHMVTMAFLANLST